MRRFGPSSRVIRGSRNGSDGASPVTIGQSTKRNLVRNQESMLGRFLRRAAGSARYPALGVRQPPLVVPRVATGLRKHYGLSWSAHGPAQRIS
jgi:hypothetical protein